MPKVAAKKIKAKKITARKKITKRKAPLNLKRFKKNPIIEPDAKNSWESKAAFNPGAVLKDGKIHLIYRAIGDNDMSVFGYASSDDGLNIKERLDYPVYFHKKGATHLSFTNPIHYGSGGGGNGGCEDPRLTLIDDKVYLLYTAFDGWGSLRIALTSIGLGDFLDKKWRWKKPTLISPPGEIHKNWVMFPEKINGKFAILHSVSPEILIDYFDNLEEFDDNDYVKSYYGKSARRKSNWDNWIRGAAAPPIKTKYGWLLLYHAMDDRDPNRYKLGAMILDKKDPAKILYRSKQPILEPDEIYENQGFKAGVVYCCGAVVKDGQLFVYYGGADKVTCVAVADLESFLKKLHV